MFSADGSRVAWYAAQINGASVLMVDGKPMPEFVTTRFAFSPDGKHFALTGRRTTDQADGVFMDGKMVGRTARSLEANSSWPYLYER